MGQTLNPETLLKKEALVLHTLLSRIPNDLHQLVYSYRISPPLPFHHGDEPVILNCGGVKLRDGSQTFEPGPLEDAIFESVGDLRGDRFGNIYVVDTALQALRKINPQGQVTTLSENDRGYLDGPLAIAQFGRMLCLYVDKYDNIFLTTKESKTSKVRMISPDGDVSTYVEAPSGTDIRSLCFDSRGNMYVTTEGSVLKILPDKTIQTFGGEELKVEALCGICIDQFDTIYLPDTQMICIHKVTAQGHVSQIPITGLDTFDPAPSDICVDPHGNLFVSCSSSVVMIPADGGPFRVGKVGSDISGLTRDNFGSLWLYCYTGIRRYTNPDSFFGIQF